MWRIRPRTVGPLAVVAAAASAAGCSAWPLFEAPDAVGASGSPATDQPPSSETVASAPKPPPLPTALPPDAVPLGGAEIRAAFTDMHESFVSIDMAGMTAEGAWLAETMSVTWHKPGGISGHLAGRWRVEDDLRCIDYRSGYANGQTECTAIYRHGGGLLSVNPDGSLHGYHELTPR